MLSMILQLGGLGNLLIGITVAAVAAVAGNAVNTENKEVVSFVHTENKEGKLDFWYQWRYSEDAVTAWRILRKVGYKHYSS